MATVNVANGPMLQSIGLVQKLTSTRVTLFCIHQMNRMNYHSGYAMTIAPYYIVVSINITITRHTSACRRPAVFRQQCAFVGVCIAPVMTV